MYNPKAKQILEFCRANGIKLAAEGYLVSAFTPTETSEGEWPPGQIEELVNRLRSMGGTLDYFESDETLFRAHSVYKHSIHDTAVNAARNAQILRDAFPNIQLADIEPFPSDLTELRAFLGAFAQESHRPFEIYNPDIAWNSEYGTTMWLQKLRQLSAIVGELGMRLAIIYNGNDRGVTNSVEWTTLAEERMAAVEKDRFIKVSDAIIQTWDRFPEQVGPATTPGTMLNLTTMYSCVVRLYRSGFLSSDAASKGKINTPQSLGLGPDGQVSMSSISVQGQVGNGVPNPRAVVILAASSGRFDGGADGNPGVSGSPRIRVLAGTVADVNKSLSSLRISDAIAGTTVDAELFGANGNLGRGQILFR